MQHPNWQKGQRVRLIRTEDKHTRLRPGTLGTVQHVDSMNTVHVKWDDGSQLGMLPSQDVIEVAWMGDAHAEEARRAVLTCQFPLEVTGIGGVDDLPGDVDLPDAECGGEGLAWMLYHDDAYWIGPPELMILCEEHREQVHHDATVDTLVIDAEGLLRVAS